MQMYKNDVKIALIPCFKWKSTNHELQIKMVILTLVRPELITNRKLTRAIKQCTHSWICYSSLSMNTQWFHSAN